MECRTELYLLQKLVVKQDFKREGKNTKKTKYYLAFHKL